MQGCVPGQHFQRPRTKPESLKPRTRPRPKPVVLKAQAKVRQVAFKTKAKVTIFFVLELSSAPPWSATLSWWWGFALMTRKISEIWRVGAN